MITQVNFTKFDLEVIELYEKCGSWMETVIEMARRREVDVSEIIDDLHPIIVQKLKQEIVKTGLVKTDENKVSLEEVV